MDYIHRSQKGGESAKLGLHYERVIVAFICARILCGKERITEIVCEYRNDIEIKRDKGLVSYQIKSTEQNSLDFQEVLSALQLFNSLDKVGDYSQFVLVSNKNLTRFNLKGLALYKLEHIPNLRERIIKYSKHEYQANFLSKVRIMRGLDIDSADALIRDELSCVDDRDRVFRNLSSLIVKVMEGLRDLSSFHIEEIHERKKREIAAKTISLLRLRNEVLDVKVGIKPDLSSAGAKFNEHPRERDEEEIKTLIKRYQAGEEFQESVLKRIDTMSRDTKLYESRNFMRFLRNISSSNDEHSLLYFLFILHNQIIISRSDDGSHAKLVSDYKKLLLNLFTGYDAKSIHCYSQVKNILQTIGLNEQEWCKAHWERILKAISKGIASEEIGDIYDNISFIRSNCKPLKRYLSVLDRFKDSLVVKRIQTLLISG